MPMKEYIFAGLDFVFDKDENPWFIEANGSPHGLLNMERLYGDTMLLEEIVRFMKRQGKELCVMASINEKYKKNRENGTWVYERLKRRIPSLRLCYIQKNSKRKEELIDSEGRIFRPDCIFRYSHKISHSFERSIRVINPMIIRYVAMDKLLTIRIIEKRLPDVRIPRTFLVKSTAELQSTIEENRKDFKNGYVLKPNYESLGFGVRVFSSPDEKAAIRSPVLLQQRIIPNLLGGKYWDLRAFLFDGRFMGGEVRKSVHKVTNVAFGGTAERAPERILERAREPAERIVRALDEEVHEKSKSPAYFRSLEKRTPKTVTNK